VTKVDGVVEIKLILKEKLDREVEAQHRLKLIAIDGGPIARSGVAIITITVLDSNDNKPKVGPPVFDKGLRIIDEIYNMTNHLIVCNIHYCIQLNVVPNRWKVGYYF